MARVSRDKRRKGIIRDALESAVNSILNATEKETKRRDPVIEFGDNKNEKYPNNLKMYPPSKPYTTQDLVREGGADILSRYPDDYRF